MTTYTEKHPKIVHVRRELAKQGIFALYGGRKGHGFWIYRTSIHVAVALTNTFSPAMFHQVPMTCITNDGVKSGNPHFWMFEDVVKAYNIDLTGFYNPDKMKL